MKDIEICAIKMIAEQKEDGSYVFGIKSEIDDDIVKEADKFGLTKELFDATVQLTELTQQFTEMDLKYKMDVYWVAQQIIECQRKLERELEEEIERKIREKLGE